MPVLENNIKIVDEMIQKEIRETVKSELKHSVFWRNKNIMSPVKGLIHGIECRNIHLILEYSDLVRMSIYSAQNNEKEMRGQGRLKEAEFFSLCRHVMDSTLKGIIGQEYDVTTHKPKDGQMIDGIIHACS